MAQPSNSVNVVNRVRQMAREAGMSLLEISRTADVSYSMLRRISRGRGNVCLAEAIAVSSALGLPVESVFVLDEATGVDCSLSAWRTSEPQEATTPYYGA